jgi:putative phosphoribosyl transferase
MDALQSHNPVFADRAAAGRALAQLLEAYRGRKDLLVLGLPRGGVPVACEVARALGAPLDVLVVRKLEVPQQRGLAMGAIASGGAVYINQEVRQQAGVSQLRLDAVQAEAAAELQRLEHLYRGERPAPEVRGHTVILVDDGVATGATLHAAVSALRMLRPAAIVAAVPVAAADAISAFQGMVDDFVCVHTPRYFRSVGQFYRQFGDTGDAEVRELLRQMWEEHTLIAEGTDQ